MQLLPDRQNSLTEHHWHDPAILPFVTNQPPCSSQAEPAGIIDLDVVRLPETVRRQPAAGRHYRHRQIEANLNRLVDELDQRLDQLSDRLTRALSLLEAD